MSIEEQTIEFDKEYLERETFINKIATAIEKSTSYVEEKIMLIKTEKRTDINFINDFLYEVNYSNPSSNVKMVYDMYEHEFMIMDVTGKYFVIEGVNFNTIEEYISIKKNDENYNFSIFKEEFPTEFTTPSGYKTFNPFVPLEDNIEEFYNNIEPISASEALNKYMDNVERRMVIFSIMNPAEVIKDIGGELIDSQTVTKRRESTKLKSGEVVNEEKHKSMDMYSVEDVEFPDTYSLYKVESTVIGLDPSENDNDKYVYILTMKDTSTERMYGLFIEPDSEGVKNKDAILAIAETFQIPSTGGEMRPMTKEEYLNNLKSES